MNFSRALSLAIFGKRPPPLYPWMTDKERARALAPTDPQEAKMNPLRLFRGWRQRRLDRARSIYSDAKDAFRRALVAGDTRRQHEAHKAVCTSLAALLRAERDAGWPA